MWVIIVGGIASGTIVLAFMGQVLTVGWRGARTLLGTIATVRELAVMFKGHIELHEHSESALGKRVDGVEDTLKVLHGQVENVLLRMERLDTEMRDLVSFLPRFMRHDVPTQPIPFEPTDVHTE